jgi:hypothetical protein
MADSWEYKIVHCSAQRWTGTGLPDDINETFDQYGRKGWELVTVESIERPSFFPWGGSTTVGLVAFFRRLVKA